MILSQEIFELEKSLKKLENLHASFDYFKITLASPNRIRSWAERILPTGESRLGEILRPETINFRTHQPESFGLFCEKIFGPIKNWKCKCGKYNGFILDKICDVCFVEILEARVRRYRMGYIQLTAPVVHLWYLKGVPNYLCILLKTFEQLDGYSCKEKKERELKVSHLETIAYFKDAERPFTNKNPLFPFFSYEEDVFSTEFLSFFSKKLKKKWKKKEKNRHGAEILKAALESIDIPNQILLDREKLIDRTSLDKTITRRLRILESFLSSRTDPSWIILTSLPVLPPTLRPLLELESGRLVAADVNEMYRLVITRNRRLLDFLSNYVVPELILIHGRKLLQESVDSLIDNARVPKERQVTLNNKPLKSLTEILEGKQGRFRQSLLGKRVDYSGRSVIVVGPNLRLNQCGLPYEMAAELFQPFLINQLLKTKIKPPSQNIRLAHVIIRKNKPFVWRLLIELTKKYAILLNRAPTLHRFGIQAFDPVIILGQAIHLHPLVCTGFNADFDGDQMAVHLPLYEVSQLEIRTMMRPSYNVLSPSNGEVILKPSQDMVIGCYYLTLMIHQNRYPVQKWFGNPNEAFNAYYQKKVSLHTPILVRYSHFDFQIQLESQENQEKNVLQGKSFQKLIFLDTKHPWDAFQQTVSILKTVFTSTSKTYFFTSLGIFIGYREKEDCYRMTDLFLETTPGRLLFSINFQNSLQGQTYDFK